MWLAAQQGWIPPLAQLKEQLSRHWSSVKLRWVQLWEVECLLALRVIPLSGLSLLLLPLPWTLPRLMALSATTPLAVLEGRWPASPDFAT